jgi:hypothetical protein
VIRDLNDRGIPTTFGKSEWSSVAFKDVLLRPRNAGLSVYQGEVIGPASWEPIILEENWRALVSVLTNPDRRTNGGNNRVKWLGSGLYLCGVCGKPELRVSTSGGKRNPAYRCKARDVSRTTGHVVRDARMLDDYVEKVIVARLKRVDAGELLIPAPEGEIDTTELGTEATALRQRLTDLSGAFAEGAITITQLRSATEKMQARLAKINDLMAQAAQGDPLAGLAGRADADLIWFGSKPDRADGLSLDRRRAVLDAIVTVTVLPAGRGRRRSEDSPYFDAERVRINWKAR